MQQYKSTLIYGFAIFSMFFGSGNLVFPIQVGNLAGSNWVFGYIGLLITGILLPFLGLFVIKLHHGNYHAFFNEAGKFAGMFIPFITLSLLGSFAVVPRCIIVAYGSVAYIFPEISLAIFSMAFCVITFFLCLKDQIMVSILGKWMSPILLFILSALILMSFNESIIPEVGSNTAFIDGFFTGYQTMDLFAAFFFSSLIFTQIQNSLPAGTSNKTIMRIAIKPSILGAMLLGLIYLGFVFLGSHYSNLLINVAPEEMLSTIANHIMGQYSTLIMAIAMLFSCLSTAVVLTNLYSKNICLSLKIKEDNFWIILLCIILIAFLVSLLDFKGIAKFLSPILEIMYPGLILLTILSICTKGYKKVKMYTFYGSSILMVIKILVS